ncbi:MAG TPA: PASTA domain-containing protein [Acidimicrobiia bacterium]|nr:PASTA domain-containing protein [Acidimicrobiia bacterium]
MAISGVADLTGRVLAARYRVLAPIGAGSSGRVYVADDIRLRRRVAIKVLHAGLADDRGFLRRFRAEAQVAASLHHPNIMAVYDWGDDEVPFMVLELLQGGSLRSLLDAGARCTPSQATHIGRQVTAALDYAHARGLVHRDIKPANLLFDEHGIVRVADFGLARALAEASWTEPAGAVVGTARYAAPEQATGAPLDGRADLYSLAIVLSEAVTGTVPGVADTAIGTLALRTHTALVAPLELGRLGPVVERAGRPNPDERYPDASTMGDALTDAARTMPPPTSLALAGLDGEINLSDPTRIGRSGALFDQDAPDAPPPVAPISRPQRAPAAGRWVGAIVALAVVLALVAGGAALASTGSSTVGVPSLVGLTSERATQALSEAGLGIRVVTRASDDPAGIVIAQRPVAGAFVSDDGTVDLVVSRGPPKVTVPEVTSASIADATAMLERLGFAVSVERRNDESAPVDAVLGTDPPSGSRQAKESVITLLVSDGPAPVTVPDVTNKTYDDAAAALAAQRFTATRAPDEFSPTVETGKVIRTDPAAGSLAARDSSVSVVVSKGPELIEVPPTVTMTLEAAQALLQGKGFEVDTVGYLPGRVVRSSNPSAGSKVPKGTKITLTF